ncbi:TonB-dependent receptor [Parabacteroides sp. Marseille-P3160]|uniref:SusC/RagA family TonB-linked outer membrane protein n=1 Tax=Parabacteroides sp. Marseille-P3160 TaxID=1917887 RepID=UPI0009BC187A|nr:TonB-dependent receptor [Parabacteroides sp. Marseille-P3160]
MKNDTANSKISNRKKPNLRGNVILSLLLLINIGLLSAKVIPDTQKDSQTKYIVSGNVSDRGGNPLISVSIVEKGSVNTSLSDMDGNYSIAVSSSSAILVFKYIGFVQKEILVKEAKKIDVVLEEDIQSLQEVVVVGYGTQKKESITGAISSVSVTDIKRSSAPRLENALAGRISGLSIMQSGGGQPGKDGATMFLRGAATTNGTSPLIMIDGVPRDNISTIDPNEVESISVLKDASATAVFGVRGANGVLMITTRRGQEGKAKLNISAEQSFTSFTRTPERLHSVEYLNMRNQALKNDGLSPAFSEEIIAKYENPLIGLDPNDPDYSQKALERQYMYPDHNYYDELIKEYTPQTRINANISGGTKKVSYFMNAGYIHQGGNLNTEPKSFLGYDPSSKMDRYSFRANLDYKISKTLTSYLNIGTYIEKVNMPYVGGMYGDDSNWMMRDLLYQATTILPITPGPTTIAGYGIEPNLVVDPGYLDRSAFEVMNRRGYQNETRANLNSTFGLNWDLSTIITPGLSIKGMISYDSYAYTRLQGGKTEKLYLADVNYDTDELSYAVKRQDANLLSMSRNAASQYNINLQGSINYDRIFGKHHVGAMFLAQRDNWEKTNGDLPYNMVGMAGRATYNYDSRYFAEVNLGYNGSEQFAPSTRFGFFPAFSVGWVLSNEAFFKDNDFITFLKLRFSNGRVGNDKMGDSRFLYLDNITMGNGPLGSLGLGKGVSQGLLGNYNLSWEVADKRNYGVDFQLLKDLSGSFDIFTENRSKILRTRQSVPSFQGVSLSNIPKANIGKIDNRGYEIELSYSKAFNKDLSFIFKGNYGYNKNIIKFVDEPIRDETYAYRYRTTGYSIGQNWGYLIDWDSEGKGYWTSEEEIKNSGLTYDFGSPRVGDFKYKDVNGDEVINDKDVSPVGYSSTVPRINYGLNLSVNYKDFDFSIFFQGVGKYSRQYSSQNVYENIKEGTYYGYHKQAWTLERYQNGEKITYPALSTQTTVNHVANDFFIMDCSFIRLKNMEIGYTLPKYILKPIGISSLRVYLSGQNLITWDHMRADHLDPEKVDPIGYPITKMMNFGLNINF